MSVRVFISQSSMDTWILNDKADLAGDRLTLRGGGGTLALEAASHFKVVSGGTDVRSLVGKVKTERAIAELGAEAYMSSVVLGDAAYEVEPGFLGTPVDPPKDGGKALLAALAKIA